MKRKQTPMVPPPTPEEIHRRAAEIKQQNVDGELRRQTKCRETIARRKAAVAAAVKTMLETARQQEGFSMDFAHQTFTFVVDGFAVTFSASTEQVRKPKIRKDP